MKYLTTLVVIMLPLILLANILFYNLKKDFTDLGSQIEETERTLRGKGELSKDFYEIKRELFKSSFDVELEKHTPNIASYRKKKSKEYKNKITEKTDLNASESLNKKKIIPKSENEPKDSVIFKKNNLTWPSDKAVVKYDWYLEDVGELRLPSVTNWDSLNIKENTWIIKLVVPLADSKNSDFSSFMNFLKREDIDNLLAIEFHIPRNKIQDTHLDLERFYSIYDRTKKTSRILTCEKDPRDLIFNSNYLEFYK